MDLGLTDRAVVVTGASKGIGLACARAFAAEGARVAIVSRSRANLDAALAAMPRTKHATVAIAADLVRADEAKRAIDEAVHALGPIDRDDGDATLVFDVDRHVSLLPTRWDCSFNDAMDRTPVRDATMRDNDV